MTVGAIRSFALVALVSIFVSSAIAQDATSGKNFWVAFPQNARFEIGGLKQWIVVTALEDAEVSVTRPAWKSSSAFTMGRLLKRAESYTFDLDTSAQCIESETVEAKGIHVGSTGRITVTAYSIRKASSDSYRIMPIEALGKDYMIVGYTAPKADPSFTTEFTVVATEDNTALDIHPTAVTRTGEPPGEMITVKLDRGQSYNMKGGNVAGLTGDLTGTKLRASSPVAVFTGHSCAQVPYYYNFCDVLIEQSAPLDRAGREFILPKMMNKIAYALRVVATEPSTMVRFGDSTTALNTGEFKDIISVEGDRYLSSDKPILVAQYANSFDADANKVGDPFMTLVPPLDRFVGLNTVTIPKLGTDWHHYLAIVCEFSALESLEINGEAADVRNTTRVNDRYCVVHLQVPQGIHRVSADGNLAVLNYGFGVGADNFDSYGTYCGPW
ncbi:MAG TPA: IgGFc-binding protein [Candidatus Kapabacteria bacterium]|nr:IgGFc-binding protein [Candidatus Kapabacteria bacterium]